jgi:hypothetical protein
VSLKNLKDADAMRCETVGSRPRVDPAIAMCLLLTVPPCPRSMPDAMGVLYTQEGGSWREVARTECISNTKSVLLLPPAGPRAPLLRRCSSARAGDKATTTQ